MVVAVIEVVVDVFGVDADIVVGCFCFVYFCSYFFSFFFTKLSLYSTNVNESF